MAAYRVIVDHLLKALGKLCETGLWREKDESHEYRQKERDEFYLWWWITLNHKIEHKWDDAQTPLWCSITATSSSGMTKWKKLACLSTYQCLKKELFWLTFSKSVKGLNFKPKDEVQNQIDEKTLALRKQNIWSLWDSEDNSVF